MAGRYGDRWSFMGFIIKFQSSPGLMAGRYIQTPKKGPAAWLVSILARLNGRALQAYPDGSKNLFWFQSSPGLMAGRYQTRSLPPPPLILFQSSPGLMAGRYGISSPRPETPSRFQSSPGLMAGRYPALPGCPPFLSAKFQSSPGLMAGRYLNPPQPWGKGFPSFNPRPA